MYTQLEIIVRAYNTNIEINGCLKVGKKAGKKMALNLLSFLILILNIITLFSYDY